MLGVRLVGSQNRKPLTMKDLKKGDLAEIIDPQSMYKGHIVVKCNDGNCQLLGGSEIYHDQSSYMVRILEVGERLEVC